jgi:4'-phosphopantetheinyl transferase
MAMLKEIIDDGCYIGLWELEEPADKLKNSIDLADSDLTLLASFSSDRRRREFLAVRHLLNQSPAKGERIGYDGAGRPYLLSRKGYISISHSESIAALLLSENPAGIDVEQVARNADRIASKFLSDDEYGWTASTENPRLIRILCWCAKEAVFKMASTSPVDFKKQIFIYPFDWQDSGSIRASLTGEDGTSLICLQYFHAKNNAVVWCVQSM